MSPLAMGAPRFFDTHCHLGLMENAEEVATQLDAAGLSVFDCGVDPREYEKARARAQRYTDIVAGVGLHPWWIANGRCGKAEVDLLCEVAATARFVGEVGLDFSPRFHGTEVAQTEAFARLCETLAGHPIAYRILSVHAVRSADTALDILEQYGLLGAVPDLPAIIFHWFSGTSEDLTRARQAGCYFSVGERMLATKRGREYARQVPEKQLLLETDYPHSPDSECPASDLRASLERSLHLLAKIRQTDALPLARATTTNAKSLFRF